MVYAISWNNFCQYGYVSEVVLLQLHQHWLLSKFLKWYHRVALVCIYSINSRDKHFSTHQVLYFFFKFFYWFLREKESKRVQYWFVVPPIYIPTVWVLFACALTGDRNHNLGVAGKCSDQLSYPSRAYISS